MVVNRKKLTAQDPALRPVETDRGMIDVPYLVLTVLLVVIGLIMLFSASYARAYYKTGNSAKYFITAYVCGHGHGRAVPVQPDPL